MLFCHWSVVLLIIRSHRVEWRSFSAVVQNDHSFDAFWKFHGSYCEGIGICGRCKSLLSVVTLFKLQIFIFFRHVFISSLMVTVFICFVVNVNIVYIIVGTFWHDCYKAYKITCNDAVLLLQLLLLLLLLLVDISWYDGSFYCQYHFRTVMRKWIALILFFLFLRIFYTSHLTPNGVILRIFFRAT